MPTDIRSFFSKAPAAKGKKKEPAPASQATLTARQSKPTTADTKKRQANDASNDGPGTKTNKRVKSNETEREEISASEFFETTSAKHKKPVTNESPSSPAAKHNKRGKSTLESKSSPPPKPASNGGTNKRKTIDILDTDDEGDNDHKAPVEDDVDDVMEVEPTPQRRSSPRKKDPPTTSSSATSATKKSPPVTKRGATKSTPAKKVDRPPPLKPTRVCETFDMNCAAPECLSGYTFVLTGVLPDGGSREDAADWIKILGGRLTSAVSSKTDYLVVLGPTLEDGRPSTEGSKYKKASDLSGVQLVHGKAALFGLMQQYSVLKGGIDQEEDSQSSIKPAPVAAAAKPAATTTNPYARGSSVASNPYAKKVDGNPYLKKSTNQSASSPKPVTDKNGDKKQASQKNGGGDASGRLWVDRYKPQESDEILGNQEIVKKLKVWLARWEERFDKDSEVGKSFSSPNGPWKAALLSGPPGIGKTTTATLVAREAGREIVEYNASDVRSKQALQETLGDITGSRSIQFTAQKTRDTKRCIIMDEVDGMGAGDRSGVSELIQMIKRSRVPIICICNDRQSQKLKSLIPYCMDMKFRRPTKAQIAKRAVEVGKLEGIHVEPNAAEAIAESCGNDVRQVLNALQMWASTEDEEGSPRNMTYRDLKERERSINKDEILRVSLFDAARLLLEGRRGLSGADEKANLSHFMHRSDAFFVDYSFTGLLVQQNYLKVMQGQFNDAKRSNDSDRVDNALENMYKAAESMSDYAHAEHQLRTDQNWSVLPFVGVMAIKTGFHAGGETGGIVPGFPEFTTWLGRNSTKGKRARFLSEMNHHMNYRISGGTTEMRLSYLPTLRTRFGSLLTARDGGVEAAIELMDEYGLDRDDVLEKMDEFKMDPKEKTFAQLLDSKKRAAFTKEYNSGVHKSQALVAEQGVTKTKKRGGGGGGDIISADPDAIDDDAQLGADDEEEEEEEEDMDAAKVAAMFKSKGRKKAPAAAAKKTGAKRGKK